jgi:hypothetical protein
MPDDSRLRVCRLIYYFYIIIIRAGIARQIYIARLRNGLINIAVRRWFQVVRWYFCRCLMGFRPPPHAVKIPALVYGIEIRVGLRSLFIPPHLSEDSDIHGAHELLTKNIETMCWSPLAVQSELEHGGLWEDSLTWKRKMWSGFLNAPSPSA